MLWIRVIIAAVLLAINGGAETREVYVYFLDDDGGVTVAERVSIPSTSDETTIKAALLLLFANPWDDPTAIPSETRLLGLTMADGGVTIDISGGVTNYGGGGARENALLEQIKRACGQVASAKTLTITIDGKNRLLPGGTEPTGMTLIGYGCYGVDSVTPTPPPTCSVR